VRPRSRKGGLDPRADHQVQGFLRQDEEAYVEWSWRCQLDDSIFGPIQGCQQAKELQLGLLLDDALGLPQNGITYMGPMMPTRPANPMSSMLMARPQLHC
jgi:hypothetical protein